MRTFVPKEAVLLPEHAQCVFHGVIFDVYQWPQKLFDESVATFEMLKRPDTVKVIPVVDGKLVVQEQEQPTLGAYFDFPGGRHDVESETELEAAKRELLEEAGMAFAKWKLVRVEQPYVKMDWLVYTFVATDLISRVETTLDAGEKIQNRLMGFAEVKALSHDPKARWLAPELLCNLHALDDLLALPNIQKPV